MAREEPGKPDIISDSVWAKLADKQRRVVAYMSRHLEEKLTTRQIKEGAGITSITPVEITNLNVKLGRLNAEYKISCSEEKQRHRLLWTMEKEEKS